MRVSADTARCEGHGLCEETAPGMYELDENAVVTVIHEEVPPELERLAEAGERRRPVAALKLIR